MRRILMGVIAVAAAVTMAGCGGSSLFQEDTFQTRINDLEERVFSLENELGAANDRIDFLEDELAACEAESEESGAGTEEEEIASEPEEQTAPPESSFESAYSAESSLSSAEDGRIVIQLSYSGRSTVVQSSSFTAQAGETLVLDIASSIRDGAVELFLFSPAGKEQRITISGKDDRVAVALSAGTWAYNCSGMFGSGSLEITGTVQPA